MQMNARHIGCTEYELSVGALREVTESDERTFVTEIIDAPTVYRVMRMSSPLMASPQVRCRHTFLVEAHSQELRPMIFSGSREEDSVLLRCCRVAKLH